MTAVDASVDADDVDDRADDVAPIEHEVVVIGAGVSGIYQIKKLVDLGVDAVLLEADDDVGGTWYRNRYPGARFDSESYTYGYSFSDELLDEWSWSERFSSQPENLRYLRFVVDRFDLRPHMRFGARVTSMHWDDDERRWTIRLDDGASYRARFVVAGLGPLSVPTLPSFPGMDDFEGPSFHTYHWPTEPLDLTGRRVGVIGTGATGIQVISAIADEVAELTVFQRRPNWSTPLNNSTLSESEMDAIRARYPEIFANCAASPNGFEHVPDRRGFWDLTPEERRATWDRLYETPGFALTAGNFPEIYLDADANREMSDYVADRIRERVDDPETAEKLIPKDHGFATQRLPLESNYFEAYNHDHVHLVDISETPIEEVTATGIRTTERHHDLDVIVYATGFDAITGGYDRLDIRGVDGVRLRDVWADGPQTHVGIFVHRFPNLFMVAGPQSVSGSTNFPRAIESAVDWITDLLHEARERGIGRIEAREQAQRAWVDKVRSTNERLLIHQGRGWFVGYNSNVAGRAEGVVRHVAYFGTAPRYRARLADEAAEGYPSLSMS